MNVSSVLMYIKSKIYSLLFLLDNDFAPNCANCIVKRVVKMTMPLGISVIRINCNHAEHENHYEYKIVKKRMLCSIIMSILIVYLGIHYIVHYTKSDLSDDNWFKMMKIYVYILTSIPLGFMILYFCLHYKLRFEDLKFLIILLKNCKNYGFNCMIPYSDSIKLANKANRYALLMIASPLLLTLLTVVEAIFQNSEELLTRSLWILSTYIFLGVTLGLCLVLQVYLKMFEICNAHLKKILKRNIKTYCSLIFDTKYIDDKLKKQQRLHSALVKSLNLFNAYLGLSVEIGILVATLLFILIIFLLINIFTDINVNARAEKISLVVIIAIILMMLGYIFILYEKIKDSVSSE